MLTSLHENMSEMHMKTKYIYNKKHNKHANNDS
jgi:hypothetical protein